LECHAGCDDDEPGREYMGVDGSIGTGGNMSGRCVMNEKLCCRLPGLGSKERKEEGSMGQRDIMTGPSISTVLRADNGCYFVADLTKDGLAGSVVVVVVVMVVVD